MRTFGVWCNKLLSFNRRNVSNACEWSSTSYVITCTCSLATGAHKPFCAPGDRGHCCEHYSVNCTAPWRHQLKRSHPLCTIYRIVSRSVRVCASGSLRVVDICPTVTGSTTPHSQLTSRVYRTHAQICDEFTSALKSSLAKIE
jgi:hypothetical protein